MTDLQQYESNKRELLDSYFTIRKLQERVNRLEEENKNLQIERDDIINHFGMKKEKYEDMIDLQRTEIDELKNEKQKAEYENEKSKKELQELKEEVQETLEEQKKEFDRERQDLLDRIQILQQKLDNLETFVRQKAELEADRKNLREQLEFERKEKQRELADKDQEKVTATDKLKKDMLHKIQETKTSLLALKKEQLQTTTRLTVLQNHQLTTELEYQSKQTEKFLFKNQKLTEQISALQRDAEIHKQVEHELAKRSHFCQQLIKRLTQRIKELEEENEELKKNEDKSVNNNNNNNTNKIEENKKDEIINQLEKHLQTVEKKLAKIQNDCDILKNENYYLQGKLENNDTKYNSLAYILAQNLEALKNNQKSIYEDIIEQDQNPNYMVDLNELRQKQVQEWSNKEKEAILNILLSQIRPLMSKKNIMTSINTSNLNNQSININIVDEQGKDQQLYLPKIHNTSQMDNQQKSIENQENVVLPESVSKKFQDVPLDISTKIVKSNLREWGKPSTTQPLSNIKNKNRRFYVN